MFGSWRLISVSIKCGAKMVFARKVCILWILLVFIHFDVNVISFLVDVVNRMHLRQLRKSHSAISIPFTRTPTQSQ